jgi:hypothetical protein
MSGWIASGAIAGALSTLAFTALHQLLISSIWFALPAMLAAGAFCGACLAWSYALVALAPSVGGWLRYNVLYLLLLVALGITSLVVFEPVTTIQALLQSGEPPRELIGLALPMTGIFIVVAAATLSAIYRAGWARSASILVTTTAVVLLLGLNISVLGLVDVTRDALSALGEVLVLLLSLAGVYAAVVVGFARSRRSGDETHMPMVPTVLSPATRARVLDRLHRLRRDAPAQWGTMSAPQMLAHLCDQMRHTLGDATAAPRPGPLRLPGVKQVVMYWLPWPKGKVKGPPEAFVTQPTTWEADVATFEQLLERFVAQSDRREWPEHAIFGRMTRGRWGRFCHRHFDHHLRQFGV